MRRRGASHASKRARVDTPTKTYSAARRKLNEILKAFAFVRVSEVTQVPARDGKPEFFHCIGTTQSNSKYDTSTERVFMDKGGRLRYNSTFDIGPCKLIDAAWGRDHYSAIPQIGDILIGVLEPNTRKSSGRQPGKVLRSWSRHGKIIMELSRMVEYGTSMTEFETRTILRQAECAMAEHAAAASALGAVPRGVHMAQSSADDFWMLARMILWGNLRPLAVLHSVQSPASKCKEAALPAELVACAEIKLSCPAYEFLSGLAFKLEDPDLLRDFAAMFDSPPAPPAPLSSQYTFLAAFSNAAQMSYAQPQHSYGGYADAGGSTPPYMPSSPPYKPKSPNYMPSSPVFSPESPPQSPPLPAKAEEESTKSVECTVLEASKVKAENNADDEIQIIGCDDSSASPSYAPTSPPYRPSSPTPEESKEARD
jgi:hypothetical protein